MSADCAQEYVAMLLYTLNGFYPAILCTAFSLKNHILMLFSLWADPEADLCSICCLKGLFQPLCSGRTKKFRLSIVESLLVIFLKMNNLKTL